MRKMSEELGFQVDLTDQDIRDLYYAVSEALRVWPGAPARPYDEQIRLMEMKEDLFRMILQMTFEAPSSDRNS